MKEIQAILDFFDAAQKESRSLGQGAAIETAILQVIRVEDSSYRREGARMLVRQDGKYVGGISGGCLEGDALQKSQMAILQKTPSVVTYDTSKDDERNIGAGLGCNGIIDVLITPLGAHATHAMHAMHAMHASSPPTANYDSNPTANYDPNPIKLLRTCVSSRRTHILVVVTEVSFAATGKQQHPEQQHPEQRAAEDMSWLRLGQTFYFADAQTPQPTLEKTATAKKFADFLRQQISDPKPQKSRSVHWQDEGLPVSVRAYVEILQPPLHVAVFGDNYDVYPVLEMCRTLGWKVSLIGNLHKLSRQAIADANHVYAKDDVASQPELDERTAILLMSHDFQSDLQNLVRYADSPAPYIGVLGPKKRLLKLKEQMMHQQKISWTAKLEKKIFGPSGLDIAADQPEEIAMSMLAEICAFFGDKKGTMLREKDEPIHERPAPSSIHRHRAPLP